MKLTMAMLCVKSECTCSSKNTLISQRRTRLRITSLAMLTPVVIVILLLHSCAVRTSAQSGPGPGPGMNNFSHIMMQTEASTMNGKSRAVDTRVYFEVAEEQPINTIVGIIPTKPGFTYRFNEVPKEFELNGSTGLLRTTVVLDRESLQTTRFDLVILSSQPTYPIEVRIVVLDVNDNAPTFPENSIKVTFSESATLGTRVILDTATDRDSGINSVATDYEIVSGNEDEKFRLVVITNPSGESPYLNLEISSPLDRENRANYQLNISAKDGGSPVLMGYLLVNITVLDVNDNPPIFDHSDYVVSLNESVIPGTNVLQVRATDSDDGENSRVTYYLNEMETRFEVDPDTGVIRTQEKLNCRQTCPAGRNCPKSCVFTVFAHDNGSPRQDGRTYVTVNLVDANDHDPIVRFRYFPSTGSFANVDENASNGSVVAAVSVIDPDDGPNGETVVEIKAGNERGHFRMEHTPSFDIVRVNGVLDREKTEKYNLTIVATDRGSPPRSSTAFLIIVVNDVNDHAPVFERSNYTSVLSELVAVGTYVASITATDEDTGINSKVYYAIVSGNEKQWFDIDINSGLITTSKPLDREQLPVVELKISARDGGPSPRWAYTYLRIEIIDENDEIPTFVEKNLNVSIMEHSPPNSPIATLTATDSDQGKNGTVRYFIDSQTEQLYPGIFAVNASTGFVTTKIQLDREKQSVYIIKIVAKDQGTVIVKSSTAKIELHVTDIDDNDPIFYPVHYFATVEESANPGTSVLQVKATDPDEGLNSDLKYAILNGAEGAFEIDSEQGVVRTTSKLNKWNKSQYRLTVVAKGAAGERKSKENAIVDILVEKNQVGQLEFVQKKGYSFTITEDDGNLDQTTVRGVGVVTASGVSGSGNTQYYIISGDNSHVFSIDQATGVISTAKTIDREVQSDYSLTVLAQDGLQYGAVNVNITINDVNDNPPRFFSSETITSVLENRPVGHEIYLARAIDLDTGSNGLVTYGLSSNPGDVFAIHKQTGMISLKKVIDYEKVKRYNIEVIATDGGTPPLSSKQRITILVEDVNDHTPVFDHLQVETSLSEGTAINDRFYSLTASDGDSGANGLVSYTIVEGGGSKFGIFPDGHLYVKSALDREIQSYYELTVVASDHGEVPRSSSVTVVIHIVDENDNAPKFRNKTFKFRLLENEPPDTYIGQLQADDVDIGRNAELTYSISGSQDGFIIDPKTGVIKSTQYFDHERLVLTSGLSYVTLEAFVTDNGLIRQQDEAKLYVYIVDINDNVPQFVRLPYKTTLSEAALVNTPVIRVSATDGDEGAGGHLTYSITDGNVADKFTIDSETGQIVLLKSLDRETVAEYTLTVMAKDAGIPLSLSATATVVIQVLDENDNVPQIISNETDVTVLENATIGTRLVQFVAKDKDIGFNSEVSFYIGAGNIHETFRIDTLTGILYLNKPLDYESRTSYSLNVTVTDSGTPHLASTVIFTVNVLDVNDNAPSFSNVAIVRQIQEGIPINTPVVTLVATDPDSGLNGKVHYNLTKQEPGRGLFAIRPETGVIYTVKDIDREFSDTFRLTVVAEDKALPGKSARLTAEKLVTVIVEDINDNSPVFVSLTAAVLPPGSDQGFALTTLFATDADTAENSKVTYEFVSGDTGLFSLDRESGLLQLNRRYDGPGAVYELVIRAVDGAAASQRRSAETRLTVIGVSPSENSAFKFAKDDYRVVMGENETVGHVLLTVGSGSSSGDADARNDGSISYYITSIVSKGVVQPRVFEVDSRTGVISTAAVLDYESGFVEYILDVAAVQRNANIPVAVWTKVKVTLLDKNDSPPSFQNVSQTVFSVSEDALPGFTVGRFVVEDPDTDGNLSYRLIYDSNGYFALDQSTGALNLQRTMDREVIAVHSLLLEASDGIQTSQLTISVTVTDSNDNPPTFTKQAYSLDIPEDAARGARVGSVLAIDTDEGINAQIGYSVISDWGNDVFSLNPQTGVFTLTSHLDYEQTQHYIFVVQAQDSGQTRLSSTVSVYINVLDLNDNAPLFDPMSYSDEVFENVTVNTHIIKVSATDQDSGKNGEISYSIVDGNDGNCFDISENGTIFTVKPLDREVQSFYNLYVMARDKALAPQKRLSSTIQVTIILKDVNDNAPKFVTPNETSIMENIPFNTVVMAVKAVDSDEGRNSYVEYSLAPMSDPKFTIGPVDGLLRVNGRLDRETASSYVLRVTAKDRGFPTMSTTTNIRVVILDENDNGPIFDPVNYSATIAENASTGSSVLQVSATDQDEGLNARLRYTIVAGDKNHDFTISEDSGIVRVANDLDYETKSSYTLTVQVEDSGIDVRYDSVTVTIAITDTNDNPPVFVNSPYIVHIMENIGSPPPAIVTTVMAYDYDAPPNGQVRYFLKDGDHGLFQINGVTGEITVQRALDRETIDRYELVVIAMDSGTPRLTGTGTVQVLVDDVNDNRPTFQSSEYVIKVKENSMTNQSIFSVTALDIDDGQNAVIRYSLSGKGEENFKIDPKTGDIFVRSKLDREQQAQYDLRISAFDMGITTTLNSTAKLLIIVEDENDNVPKFEQVNFSVYIPDSIASGQFVFGATALDPDVGVNSKLNYELLGTHASSFTLNKDIGVIKNSGIKSKDGLRTYHFDVKVSDEGKPSLSSKATIEVNLLPSRNFPVFNQPGQQSLSFQLSESEPRGKVITTVSATSPKSGPSGQIRYNVAGGNVGDTFAVDSLSGRLSVSGVLDYETTSQYELWIQASDSDIPPMRSVMAINISILDANDNKPVFEKTLYNATVLEEELPPQTVITVKATDADSGKNGRFSYQIKRQNPSRGNHFAIDSKTGRIFTNAKLDRETVSTYTLIVEATDQGSNPNTGVTTVIVNIMDKNDNPPRFTRLFSANVTENAEIGSFVIQVTSSDRDIGSNANASYSFTENPGGRFKIDPIGGNVTVAAPIDREFQDEYILKVSALDGSWRAETPLTITVQDVNDNAPEFEKDIYEFQFPELQRNVAFVGKVVAVDKDKQGPNAYVSYSLKQSSDLFDIDPSSGEIYSKHSLTYKHTRRGSSPENRHTFTVIAKDHGKPPLTRECTVAVDIVDSNNNPPRFLEKMYISPVPESAASGLSILNMSAVDEEDYGNNAEVEYMSVGGNGSSYFTIDNVTGWINVISPVSGRKGTVLELRVRAVDKGIPPQKSETSFYAVVTGENRFGPTFAHPHYQVIVPEDEAPKPNIVTLSATDPDTGLNGKITYRIIKGDSDNRFVINPSTGQVSIIAPVDYEKAQEYYLNVSAEDGGFYKRSAYTILHVVVSDVNDNKPIFDRNIHDAFIEENSKVGMSIYKLSATDADSGRHAVVQYSIVGGDGKELFEVEPQTGVITTNVIFDMEEKESYNLEVLASNPDTVQYSSAKVVIHVTGKNEFYPHFIQSVFQFTVSESSPVGTSVGTVVATDRDGGVDGDVLYILVGSSSNKGFVVNPQTGVVYVSRRLDREILSRMVLTVVAKNRGPIRGNDTDEAQVVIQIQDGNDPPTFSELLYEVHLAEDAVIGSKAIEVRATDRDTRPANSHFTYSIIAGNQNANFKIDPLSGEIRTAAALDHEVTKVYNLTIAAIDSGVPPQTGTTIAKIYIDDVNDNGPVLDPPNQIGSVAEDEPPDTIVMKLSISDPDLPPNGAPFLFAIVGGEHKDSFLIDRSKGVIRTRQVLDRETSPEMRVMVEVQDAGSPPMKSVFPVTVIVRDKNDNPALPRNVTVLAYFLPSNMVPDQREVLLADVHPLDLDLENGFHCMMLSSSKPDQFFVQDGCKLFVKSVNGPGSYSITLTGSDGIHPEVTVNAHLMLRLLDNKTIDNSVTVRIPNITSSVFVGQHLTTFSSAITQLLAPLNAKANVFSVAQEGNDAEVFISAFNAGDQSVSIAGRDLAQVLSGGGLGRTLGRSLTVDYDPCDDSPCKNGGQCTSEIVVLADNTSSASSPLLILSSTSVRKLITCKCHQGYTGERCEYRMDPCSPSPCHNGGTCNKNGYSFTCTCSQFHRGTLCENERTDACAAGPCKNGGTCQETPEGNYFCMCRPGFRGGLCDITDGCRPNPCENGGACIPTKPGYKCNCVSGYYGRHCERSTFGFHELSYATYPSLDANSNDVAVVFSTTKPDGLLIYNYGSVSGGRSDFVALEIYDGQLKFSFGGRRTHITSLHLDVNVTSGNWHKVIVTRNGKMASMSVVNCWDNGASCNECFPGDSKCSVEKERKEGDAGSLNFEGEQMYLGGIPSIRTMTERPGQVRTDDFVGCIQSVWIDGKALDLSRPITSRGTSNVCPRFDTICRNDPCSGHGKCVNRWFGHLCLCENSIMASDCQEDFKPFTFEGGTYVEFFVSEKHRRRQLLELTYSGSERRTRSVIPESKLNSLSLQFRTSANDGMLLYLATNSDYTTVYIKDGLLYYTSKLGTQPAVNLTLSDVSVSNGEWHNVSLLHNENVVYVGLSGDEQKKQVDASIVHEFLDPYLTKVIVGGADTDLFSGNVLPNFEGCIAGFVIGSEVQSFNTSDGIFQASPHGRLKRGCYGPVLVQGAASTDPLNIGVTLVIVFFIGLIVAILVSFIVFRRRRQKRDKSHGGQTKPNGSAITGNSPADNNCNHQDSGFVENGEVVDDQLMRNHFNQELATKKFKEREVNIDRPQRPDIIERGVVHKPPVMSSRMGNGDENHVMKDCTALSTVSALIQDSEAPEHYDLENASSIAPSDIDIVYHYKGYRDGNMRKYKTNPHITNYHKNHHRHSPHLFQTSGLLRESPHSALLRQSPSAIINHVESPNALKMQSTPLARLSPSSELSQQTPRILTLQDISGRPLQSALLATSQGRGVKSFKTPVTNSERSLNSPVSHLSQSTSSIHSQGNNTITTKNFTTNTTNMNGGDRDSRNGVGVGGVGTNGVGDRVNGGINVNKMNGGHNLMKSKMSGVSNVPIGLTAEEIERLNTRPRNSSLVSTMDVVSSSSDDNVHAGKDKLAELMETNTELLEAADSSTDESGNDSFTCSEFEYENNYDKSGRDFRTGNMIFSKLAEVDNENDEELGKGYDGFESFRGSLSTLVASDDDVSNMSYKPASGPSSSFSWDCLLNWGPSFESMVGVFKDIAELPDTSVNNPKPGSGKPGEEYV